jgi:hypothetical protein
MGPLSLLCSLNAARAQPPDLEVSGHLKSFTVASFSYEAFRDLQPSPAGQAAADARLNLAIRSGPFTFLAHHAVTTSVGGASSGLGGFSTGVGLAAPELIDLTWSFADEGATAAVQGRTDRLYLRAALPAVDITLGRQPVSFGSGLFFSPIDLVNPFFPTTIDTEYKPGVDALRTDVYISTSRITLVAAYAGEEGELKDLTDLNLAASSQITVATTDFSLFYGSIHRDQVFGAGIISSIGPVGVHTDATYTLPDGDDEEPFARVVLGADGRPAEKVGISGEVYLQTLGVTDPDDYLQQLSGERYARGELWTAGRYYAAISLGYQVVPLISLSGAVIANLSDPSAFIAPGISWSISGNADAVAGAYFGVGERPVLDEDGLLPVLDINSEFGLYPSTAFFQLRSYF